MLYLQASQHIIQELVLFIILARVLLPSQHIALLWLSSSSAVVTQQATQHPGPASPCWTQQTAVKCR